MEKNSNKEKIKKAVRNIYGQVADGKKNINISENQMASCLGYSTEQINAIPIGAQMGIGCGNPFEIVSIKPGEVVLDLGCGAGFDVFYASGMVGEKGRVIGIDMTPEMIPLAKDRAIKRNLCNIEFQLGDIENLPLADESIDVIISNCVINLSPDKNKVFRETYRVLKPGGRLAVADIVSIQPLPDHLKNDFMWVAECVCGAVSADEIRKMLLESGFNSINITVKDESLQLIQIWLPGGDFDNYIRTALIAAEKPS